jgi:hypothetical protein
LIVYHWSRLWFIPKSSSSRKHPDVQKDRNFDRNAMAFASCDSPSAVDGELEYLTVESYNWPKPSPPSRRRHRLNEEERKRRHVECQKRFLARKQQLIKQLPQTLTRLELQLKLVEAIRETEALQGERNQLFLQLAGLHESRERKESLWQVEPQDDIGREEKCVVELVTDSLNVDALVAELGPPTVTIE